MPTCKEVYEVFSGINNKLIDLKKDYENKIEYETTVLKKQKAKMLEDTSNLIKKQIMAWKNITLDNMDTMKFNPYNTYIRDIKNST